MGILAIEPNTCKDGSYRSAIFWFLSAVICQLIIAFATVIWRGTNQTKDYIIKICNVAVVCIFGYLLVYFFIFDGCEELIKFWVLGNLWVMIVIGGAKIFFILIFKGKEELKRAMSKKGIDSENSIN